jgi:hypothetical protein
MLLYTNLREQLDEQFPSLASRARQTLAKTCYPHADLWTAFRSTSQLYRSARRKCAATPTIDRPESIGQTTSTDRLGPFSSRTPFPLHQILETIAAYRTARYTPELASESVSQLLAAEVTRQAKG